MKQYVLPWLSSWDTEYFANDVIIAIIYAASLNHIWLFNTSCVNIQMQQTIELILPSELHKFWAQIWNDQFNQSIITRW